MFCLHVYMYITCMSGVRGSKKRALGLLELVVSCLVGTRNQTPMLLSAGPFFQSLSAFLKKIFFIFVCVHMMCMYMIFMWVHVSWCSHGGQDSFVDLVLSFHLCVGSHSLFMPTWQAPLPQSHLTGLIALAWFSFLFSSSAWVEPWAPCMLGQLSTTKLHPQPIF